MSSPTVRGKFTCVDKTESGDQASLKFAPVYSGSKENESFFKYTPGGSIDLQVVNPAAAAVFTKGEEYYVDFKSAKPSAVPASETDAGVIADKELRRDLDTQLQKLKALPASRERSLTITKLQEAIMWLGMDLKRLNDTRPYPSSYDPSTTKVERTADGLSL